MSTPAAANATHFEVGKKVRYTIEELGGTMPEDLPTPERGISELEAETKHQIAPKKGKKKK